jgi:hypothetical protein
MALFAWGFVLDLVVEMRMVDEEQDLELMLLRQQLRIVERKQQCGPQMKSRTAGKFHLARHPLMSNNPGVHKCLLLRVEAGSPGSLR